MKMIIGGKKAGASDGAEKKVINPTTLKVIDTVPAATEEDVKQAIQEAKEGQKEWAEVPLCERVNIIRRFNKLFLENKEWFLEMGPKEIGKCKSDVDDEIGSAATIAEHFCNIAPAFKTETFPPGDTPGTEHNLMITVREPYGVCACILPYNFPIEMFMHKTVPALLMGNSIVIKPASDTCLVDIKMAELLLEAGVTPKAVNLVTGSGATIGDWLTTNPDVGVVTFTGSTAVGKQIGANCGANLIPLVSELGGNDSLVILDDADIDYAVEQAVYGRKMNSGQVCCSNKRILVQNSIKDEFAEKLKKALEGLTVGNPFDDVSYGTLVSVKAARDVEDSIKQVLEEGGKLLTGGKRFNETMVEPTLVDVNRDNVVAKNLEIFGPVWSMIGFDTDDDAIEISNQSDYGLSGGVITKDMNRGMHVAHMMDTGTVIINGSGLYRTAGQAFGGNHDSGIGREGGAYSFANMTKIKTIVLSGCYK